MASRPGPSRLARPAAAKAQRLPTKHAAEEALLRAELALADAEQAAQEPKAKRPRAARPPPTPSQADQARPTSRRRARRCRRTTRTIPPLGPVYPPTSTGRRLALARWIVDRKNPLTARVAVNHIWMRHFGTPLVPTVFDFGVNGKPPTHPALLDWLAVELMDRAGG